MFRFLLVVMTCAVPFLAQSATFHAGQGKIYNLVSAPQYSMRFIHPKTQLGIKRALKQKKNQIHGWHFVPIKRSARPEKPIEIWQARSESPRIFYFKEFPYRRPFLRPGAGPFRGSNDINVVMVPTLSSFVFMLTMMAALFVANQKDYARKITAHTRPLAFLRWARMA